MVNYQTLKLIATLNILPSHWLIIPCKGKKPLGYQWQKYPWCPQSLLEELNRGGVPVRDRHGNFYKIIPTGVGVLCGQNEKEFLVAVDCDGYSAIERIAAIEPLPKTVAFTSGKPGRAQYLFKVEGDSKLKSRKIPTAAGEALELRGSNLPSVLPPSVHPETGFYRWLPGCCPSVTEVATAPKWIIKEMSQGFHSHLQVRNIKTQRRSFSKSFSVPPPPCQNVTLSAKEIEALTLLEAIHPQYANNYWTWIQIGMALHSVSPALFQAWDNWSQSSPKYKPGECAYKWRSFLSTGGITISTLYGYANFSQILPSVR